MQTDETLIEVFGATTSYVRNWFLRPMKKKNMDIQCFHGNVWGHTCLMHPTEIHRNRFLLFYFNTIHRTYSVVASIDRDFFSEYFHIKIWFWKKWTYPVICGNRGIGLQLLFWCKPDLIWNYSYCILDNVVQTIKMVIDTIFVYNTSPKSCLLRVVPNWPIWLAYKSTSGRKNDQNN